LEINTAKIPLESLSLDVIIFEEFIEHLYNSYLVVSKIKRISTMEAF
jgi:hypothetical protein